MKKIIFLVAFLSIIIFCLPLSAFGTVPPSGAVMELTVTITSIQIPARAAMSLLPVNTEFILQGSSIAVTDGSGNVQAKVSIPMAVKAGATVTVPFPYNTNLGPYKVYLQSYAPMQGDGSYYNNFICKADCSSVDVGAGWYWLDVSPSLPNTSANCPNPPCNGRSNSIAVDPQNIAGHDWRSPVLFTIN